jgi:hypothetical protein
MNVHPEFLADMNQDQAKATSWNGSPCFLGLIWMVTFLLKICQQPEPLVRGKAAEVTVEQVRDFCGFQAEYFRNVLLLHCNAV